MENNDKIKKIVIKSPTYYYFDDIIKIEDFDFNKVSYKTLICAKPLRIRLDKVDGFIRHYNEIRCLILLGPEKNDAIYNKIKYIFSQRGVITYVILKIM